MKVKCIYPTGLEITKSDIESLKEFKQIVLNYLKINRLRNETRK